MNQHVRDVETAGATFVGKAESVARIAATHAIDVDLNSRFPKEAVAELRNCELLGVLIPKSLGGGGASLAEVAEICGVISKECASSAMLFAMHQIMVSSLITFGQNDEWHCNFLKRVAKEQLLLASATTEAVVGGDVRSSVCAIEPVGNEFRIEKQGTVISYGRHADAILITARRHSQAVSSDQVMATITRDQYQLEGSSAWDTLGMRGTASEGFTVKAQAPLQQVLPAPFADIAAQSMLPTSHTLWSSVWYGIAAGALIRAQNLLRSDMKNRPDIVPPGVARLAQASSKVQLMRSNITAAIASYEKLRQVPGGLSTARFGIEMNNLKTSSSQTAIDIILLAFQITGIRGYRNDTPFSLGRHLRDALSAPIMINNDRIDANTANLLLVNRETGRLLG
jgi:acyl-CoA dehydrogenase